MRRFGKTGGKWVLAGAVYRLVSALTIASLLLSPLGGVLPPPSALAQSVLTETGTPTPATTWTPTATATATASPAGSPTATATSTASPAPTATVAASGTAAMPLSPTRSPSLIPVASATTTPTGSATPTEAPTGSTTPVTTATAAATVTATLTATPTATPTAGTGPGETLEPIDSPVQLAPKGPEGKLIRADAGGAAYSEDGRASANVERGGLDGDTRMTIERVAVYTGPSSRHVVGGVYDFHAVNPSSGARVTNFSRGLTISLTYRLEELQGTPESSLSIYYWNESASSWEEVPSKLDRKGHVLTAKVNHFSQYSIQGESADSSDSSFGIVPNGGFENSSYTLVGGPDNANLNATPYVVLGGPENANFDSGAYTIPGGPENADFETGDLSGWTIDTGSAADVRSGSFNDSYYAWTKGTNVTSSTFVLPSDTQTIHFWGWSNYGSSGTVQLYASDGTTLLRSFNFGQTNAWKEYSFNVASWAGSQVKLRFNSSWSTEVRFDNITLVREIPGWETVSDTAFVMTGVDRSSPYVRVTSGYVESLPFALPADVQTIHFWGYSGTDWYGIVQLLDSSGTELRSFNFGAPNAWKEFSFNVTSWRGQQVKLRFNKANSEEIRVDDVSLVREIPGWETTSDVVYLASDGGPFGRYARLIEAPVTSSDFTLPSDSKTIHFWGWSNYGSNGTVQLFASDGTTLLRSFNFGQTNVWSEYSFNVASWAGSQVKLRFNSSWKAEVRFDNITLDSSGNFLGESNSGCTTCGQPVNMTIGNMTHTWDDLAIPGRGLGLGLSRSYNSMALASGPFGKGWTFNHGMSLLFNTDNSIFVVHPDGRQVIYTPNADGSYARPLGVYEILVKNADGTYTLSDKSQTRFSFGLDGKLMSVADKNGNTISLSNEGGGLRSVTDPSGRSLTFSYGVSGDQQILDTPTSSVPAFPNADFEQGNYTNWSTTGTSFGTAPATAAAGGRQGTYFASSYHPTNSLTATGTLTSVPFTAGKQLLFKLIGNTDAVNLKASLLLPDGTEVLSYTCTDSGNLRSVTWDTTQWEGQQIRLQITDSSTTGWIGIDDVRVVNAASGTTQATLGPNVLPFANANFEDGSYLNWFASGTAFGVRPVTNAFANIEGTYSGNSYYPTNSDSATGSLTSTYFTAGRSFSFRINGGSNPTSLYVALVLSDGSEVLKTTHAAASSTLDQVTWDTSPYEGQTVRIRITDNVSSGGWGWIGADNFRILYASNLVQQVTDPAGRAYRYTYDSTGNLVTYTDPLGGTVTYEYGPYGMIRATDQNGHVIMDNGYDTRGRIVEQLDALGNLTTFSYDVANRTTTFTDQLGHTHVTVFDSYGRTVRSVDELGNAEVYTYDSAGNRDSVTDRNGNTTRYTYDSMGNVTSATDPLGAVESWTYDARNNPLTHTDALGGVTHFDYDAAGNLTSTTDPLSGVTAMAYDTHGQLTSSTDPTSRTTGYGYDANGNQTSETDPAGKTTTRTFDAAGRMTAETDPLNHTTTFAYRADGKLTGTTDALGHTTTSPENVRYAVVRRPVRASLCSRAVPGGGRSGGW